MVRNCNEVFEEVFGEMFEEAKPATLNELEEVNLSTETYKVVLWND